MWSRVKHGEDSPTPIPLLKLLSHWKQEEASSRSSKQVSKMVLAAQSCPVPGWPRRKAHYYSTLCWSALCCLDGHWRGHPKGRKLQWGSWFKGLPHCCMPEMRGVSWWEGSGQQCVHLSSTVRQREEKGKEQGQGTQRHVSSDPFSPIVAQALKILPTPERRLSSRD